MTDRFTLKRQDDTKENYRNEVAPSILRVAPTTKIVTAVLVEAQMLVLIFLYKTTAGHAANGKPHHIRRLITGALKCLVYRGKCPRSGVKKASLRSVANHTGMRYAASERSPNLVIRAFSLKLGSPMNSSPLLPRIAAVPNVTQQHCLRGKYACNLHRVSSQPRIDARRTDVNADKMSQPGDLHCILAANLLQKHPKMAWSRTRGDNLSTLTLVGLRKSPRFAFLCKD